MADSDTIFSRDRVKFGFFAALVFAGVAACGAASTASSGAAPSGEAQCGGETHKVDHCAAVAGVAQKTQALKSKSDATPQEKIAFGRIDEELSALSAQEEALCKSYLACELNEAQYREKMSAIVGRVEKLPVLVQGMTDAQSVGQRKQALDEMYRAVVPEEKRIEELTFRMAMAAQLPASAGGNSIDVEPGSVVPTNAMVYFGVEVSKEAYLYIFQRTPTDEVSVLFPDSRIGTQNPLLPGTWAQIPSGGDRFRVNEKDLGMENVYIVASLKPIDSLDGALKKVKDGAVTQVAQDSLLKSLVTVKPGQTPAGCQTRALEFVRGGVLLDEKSPAPAASTEGPECTRSRGLVLAPGAASVPVDNAIKIRSVSMLEVRSEPGDNLIVKVFPFKHVTEAAYPDEIKKIAENEKKGIRSRGVIMEY